MLQVIENLLILQDRDHKILRTRQELTHIPIERSQLLSKSADTQTLLDQAKLKLKQIESERKRLELEAEEKKQLIDRYSIQQFQTKKNEEYRALSQEINTCKRAISSLEDQQLELMEQSDAVQKQVKTAQEKAAETKLNVDDLVANLAQREDNLKNELAELEQNRGELAAAVEEGVRDRYERLTKSKGPHVLVGIQHGVCGGCHMKLSRQLVVSCQAEQEIVFCSNCGRILFYTPDMDLAVAD